MGMEHVFSSTTVELRILYNADGLVVFSSMLEFRISAFFRIVTINLLQNVPFVVNGLPNTQEDIFKKLNIFFESYSDVAL